MKNENQSTPSVTLESNQPSLESAAPATQELQTNTSENKKKLPTVYIFVLITIIFIVLGGIGYYVYQSKQTGGVNQPTALEPILTHTNTDNIVDDNNRFALDYYSQLKEKDSDNIFFSPFSISSALAMTYEGAKGQTAEEMRSVFYFSADDSLRRSEYADILSRLSKEDKKYQLSTANALWAQKDYQFLADYLDTVEQYYGGKANDLDFKTDPEGSRITINDWVEDQTHDKIVDLIPRGAINALTRLILTNAIYFKGEWVKQFNVEDTKDASFRISNNNSVTVPMMQRTDEDAEFNYAKNDKLQILEMPYSGEELSMLILLPQNNDLTTIENSLSTKKLSEWGKDLENQRVKVYIPKFKFETKYFMADDLKTMGMPTAFKWPDADFSGMDGTKNLYIDKVIHQAFIEVNEEGTEAAAATAVIMELGSAPGKKTPEIPVFRADHPFIFLIQEKASGNILFMGRVINPTS